MGGFRDVYERAACQRADPDAFFLDDTGELPAAVAELCAACPVRQQCLEMALADNLRVGIYGGTTPRQRERMRRKAGATKCRNGHSIDDHGYVNSGGQDRCRKCDSEYVHRRRQDAYYTPEDLASMKNESCVHGHPWKDTLYVSPQGKKWCRTCRREAKERDRAKARGGAGKCLQGHDITGDNVILYDNGTRRCKQCHAANIEQRRARRVSA